jgi:precorrin-2 dehydrogenase / sirohydrochlorin ferrochelatase
VPAAYPILLDVTDKRIVIVGGGAVGLRKAVKLLEAGATDVTVVSPAFAGDFPPAVKKVQEPYRPEHLAGAALVVAATDSPQANADVAAEARRRNALVSRADSDDGGDFTTPAVLREGVVTVAVWADNPSLSAGIRDGLRACWDPRWTNMAQVMRTLRPIILHSSLPAAQRRQLLHELAGEAAMEKLAAGGVEALRNWVMERLNELSTNGH